MRFARGLIKKKKTADLLPCPTQGAGPPWETLRNMQIRASIFQTDAAKAHKPSAARKIWTIPCRIRRTKGPFVAGG